MKFVRCTLRDRERQRPEHIVRDNCLVTYILRHNVRDKCRKYFQYVRCNGTLRPKPEHIVCVKCLRTYIYKL